jgi:DNA-binding IclR family transcriptional regulator
VPDREQAVAGPQGKAPPFGAVQSVERVIALLGALGRADQPLSIARLAAAAALPRPTVYRLIQTLTTQGMTARVEGGYVIGPRILWLAGRRLEQIELRAVGRPVLSALRDRTGETVHLAVLEQGQVVYIDKSEPPGPMRMASAIGKIMPAHCTALGKAMLAFLPAAEVARIIETWGLPRRTPNTITDRQRLLAELAAVRARGYAVDNVENEEGVRCVGAPIFDHDGRVAGAVSCSGPTRSITRERVRRSLGPEVRRAAAQISQALGWTAPSAERGERR